MQSYEASLDGKTIKYRAGTTIEEFLAETSSRLRASAPATQTLPLLLPEWKFTICAPVAFLLCLCRLGADLGHLHSAGALRARYQDDEVSTRCPLHQPDHTRFPAPSLRLKRIRPPFRPLAPLPRLLRFPPCRVGACLHKGTYAE
jgi:hypothetical protein